MCLSNSLLRRKRVIVNEHSSCRPAVVENVSSASFKVKLDEDNVAGVHLPIFKQFSDVSNVRMYLPNLLILDLVE